MPRGHLRGNSQPRGRGSGRGRGAPNNLSKELSNKTSEQNVARKGINLELMPSISRSGGDNGEGDSLKDEAIQEQYWVMIQEKIEAHWKEFPSRSVRKPSQMERESNILLLLRKLREGVLSSQRKDIFALDAYETSFYLAVIFESSVQASSTLSYLPELYSSLLSKSSSNKSVSLIGSRAEALFIVSLVFHLSETFPSQMTYFRQIQIFKSLCPSSSIAQKWVSSIRASINYRNYAKFDALTCESRLNSIIGSIQYLQDDSADKRQRHHARASLFSAVSELRRKHRGVAWSILRSAYREFELGADTDTNAWLSRSVFLKPVGDTKGIDVEEWMERCTKDGHIVKKEGFPGRWTTRRSL